MKKNKLKTVWFYDEVYKRNILFLIGDKEDAKKFVSKNYNNLEIDISTIYGARTFNFLDTYGIIIYLSKFDKTPTSYGYLIHEIIHASNIIFRTADIDNHYDDEPYAYHCEFLMRKFLEIYNKK